MKTKTKATIAIVTGLIILSPFIAYEALLFWAHDFNPDYNKIDRCLDAGGRWDYENKICIMSDEQNMKSKKLIEQGNREVREKAGEIE